MTTTVTSVRVTARWLPSALGGVVAAVARTFLILQIAAPANSAMISRKVRRVGGVLFLLVASQSCRGFGQEDLTKRLRKEAPPAWSQMQAAARRMDVEFQRIATTDRSRMTSTWNVKWNQDNLVGILKDELLRATPGATPIYREAAFGRNSKNAFRVQRAAADQAWVVEDFNHDLAKADELMLQSMRLYAMPLFALMVNGQFLPDWFQEKTFTIKKVRWDDTDSGHRVALEFEYQWPANKKLTFVYWPRSGTLFLRPDLSWAIEDFQVTMVDSVDPAKREFQMRQHNVLKDLIDGFPAVISATQVADTFTEGHSETNWTFTRFENTGVPEREFTLPAFGLPEIGGNPAAIRWWLIGVNSLGVLLILLGIIFRRVSRISPRH